MIFIGENRREAITYLQDMLGSITPRPLAEQTLYSLGLKKKIVCDSDGKYYMTEGSDIAKGEAEEIVKTNNKNHTSILRHREHRISLSKHKHDRHTRHQIQAQQLVDRTCDDDEDDKIVLPSSNQDVDLTFVPRHHRHRDKPKS